MIFDVEAGPPNVIHAPYDHLISTIQVENG
jgi:hypothetical protein